MDVLEYRGKIYKRYKKNWMDSSNLVVCDGLQRELNREYVRKVEITSYSLEECIEQGDKLKKSHSPKLAIKFFEEALTKADEKAMKELFPRITSCYRENDQPQKAIDIFNNIKSEFGNKMISAALLTSVGAAYCDIEDYVLAKKCCDRAYAMLQGTYSVELSLVYQRIKSATK